MESELLQALDSIANSIDVLAEPGVIDWISLVISCVSIILSGMAIWFAVRIGDKENRVSLLEKRIECYKEIQTHKMFLDNYEQHNDFDAVLLCFASAFSDNITENIEDLNLLSIKINSKRIFLQMASLYKSIEFYEVDSVIKNFFAFVDTIEGWKHGDEIDQDVFAQYFQVIGQFIEKHEEIIQKNMKI